MHLTHVRILLAAVSVISSAGALDAEEPQVTDKRFTLELVAADPQIVTPIGMAFDRKGRLLVIESHTHQRLQSYKGLPSDRIRMNSDSDGDGMLDYWTTFAEGFSRALNLVVARDNSVFLICRNRIVHLQDTDGDGVSDKQDELLTLETKDDYSHNGLNGIALDAVENIVFSFGENHGLEYRMTGADGAVIKDTGGHDGFFRMTRDGKNLRRIARGVWNPFSVCVVPDGRIFAVDNDPDSSPPCRLLHVVEGGDYGYLFQYGRAGTHPLQAWNGELPGTLPMVCGVGEAPTAIVPHAGGLWVTSWGDHRIERYDLTPRGASYGAKRTVIVQGVNDFRPTGMAVAPDGSIYFGDWVLLDYPVHGRGRIWHLTLPEEEAKKPFPPRSKEDLAAENAGDDPISNAASPDPFIRTAAAYSLSQGQKVLPIAKVRDNPLARIAFLQSVWLRGDENPEVICRIGLNDESPEVRMFAVRWLADTRMMSLRGDVAKLLEGPQTNAQFYRVVLGALDWLDRKPNPSNANFSDEILVRELQNKQRSPEAHALALAYVKPDHKLLPPEFLATFLQSDYEPLRLEAVRTLAQQSSGARFPLLEKVAEDAKQKDEVRAEALVGLAAAAEKQRAQLEKLAASDQPVLKKEAERYLRLAGLHAAAKESKPPADDLDAWYRLLAKPGDAAAGRRLFFSAVGPRCSVCHSYAGRGGIVGPELTNIGRNTPREKIITSILQPSREIAPDYQPWVLVTNDGKSYTGLLGIRGGVSEKEVYIDDAGKTFALNASDIESRQVSAKSIMPENLQATLSIDDLRDIVTFLASPTK